MDEVDDELRVLRERLQVLEDELDRLSDQPPAPSPMLVQTTEDTSYPPPAAIAVTFATDPLAPGGTEAEGSAVTTTAREGPVMVGNAGSKHPPVNTKLVAFPIGNRWIMVYNG